MRKRAKFLAGSWLVAVLVLAGLLVVTGPAAAQGDDPAPTPFWEANEDPALNAEMDHVEQATSILRDLPAIEPVTRAFITRDELLAYLMTVLDEDYPPEAARDDVIFYHAFDFMDLDVDLRQLQIDVLAEQIGGFYDPELEAMFVISESDAFDAMNSILYAHEFTHVLQDQYFDLMALGLDEDFTMEEPDQTLALQALIEGDAMLMTEGYQTWMMEQNPGLVFNLLGDALGVSTEVLLSAPQITQIELMFPYTDGRNFAYTLFAAGEGWPLVNDAYSNPPQTTEHILHPERYVAGESAQAVTLPVLTDVLDDGWRQVWDRTLGEFYLREHLRATIPRETADHAAAGWGGDRYHVYFNDNTQETVLVWRTVWDTTNDAAEFAAAYRGYGALHFDDPGVPTDDHTVCWYGDETRCLFSGTVETLVVRVPDQAMIADVMAVVEPVR